MRKLALHFTHPQSFIGIVDEKENYSNIIKVDNVLLFKQRALFAERMISVVKSYTGSSKKFDSITFSFNGKLNKEEKEIIHNEELDYVSYTDSYDGYSFKKHFEKFCKKSGKIVLQPHHTTYRKSIETLSGISTPALFLYDDYSLGIGIVVSNFKNFISRTLTRSIKSTVDFHKEYDDDYISKIFPSDEDGPDNKLTKENFKSKLSISAKKGTNNYNGAEWLSALLMEGFLADYKEVAKAPVMQENHDLTRHVLNSISDKKYDNHHAPIYDGNRVIFDVAEKRSINIIDGYSQSIKQILDTFLEIERKRETDDIKKIETVCIISNQASILSERVLVNKKSEYKLIIEPIDSANRNFPMAGCGIFQDNFDQKQINATYRFQAKRINFKKNLFDPLKIKRNLKNIKTKTPLDYEVMRIEYRGYKIKLLNEFSNFNDFEKHLKKVQKHNKEDHSYIICFSEREFEKISFSIKEVSKLALWKIEEAFV